MKTVTINFDSIEFECLVVLNQKDNIEQGFEIKCVALTDSDGDKNFQHILDQDKLIKLIFEQLENL